MGDNANKILDIVPEIFYDLISRIIPRYVIGGVAILLKWDDIRDIIIRWGVQLKDNPLAKEFLPQISLLFITLVIAYVIGLFLDVLGDMIVDNIIINLFKLKINSNKCFSIHIDALQGPKGAVLIKMLAELVLFRSLCIVSLMSAFYLLIKLKIEYGLGALLLSILLAGIVYHFNSHINERLDCLK
jgi:hypothetical protein